MGVNNKKELAVAEYIAQSKLREKFLIKGVTLVDPETVYFSEDTKIDKDVVIYPNVFIGKNVRIGKGSKILSFSHLEDCSVGKDVTIGPFARLRPGADIKDEVKVGNFVEIKKSKIDKNSKVNHLTYIGDTEIGKDVNIGAGTITCNYDGKNKFKTIIEDGAFIGSNSSLIAPVKIGKNAYVGSGSAISKNIREKALGIERTNQIEIKNWHRKIKKK
jgi:bifunctional UDP-N-acetylglucosamine pyrophosphorylase/glucosamine-1-phosphate N-acetyltransferase